MRPSLIMPARPPLPGSRACNSGSRPAPCSASAYPSKPHACVPECDESVPASRCPPPKLVVERVALHGDAPGGPDRPHQLVDLLLRLGARAGRVEDLLAHDRALHVV